MIVLLLAEAALREQELLDSHSKALEEKDETIKSLQHKFDEEKIKNKILEEKIERHQSELKEERQLSSSLMKEREKEKKKLREMHKVKDVAIQFDYIVPHSGECACVCRYDVCIF